MHSSDRRFLAILALFFALAPGFALAAEFHGLGTPELFVHQVHGATADGKVAVGTRWHAGRDAAHAVIWKDGVVNDLGTLGGRRSWASKISVDASVIVGGSDDGAGNTKALHWRGGVMTALQFQPGSPDRYGTADGVSADGSIIVGSAAFGSVEHAFRWVGGAEKGVMTSLGVSNGDRSRALDASADGSVVVGIVGYPRRSAIDQVAFRWVEDAKAPAGGGTMTLLHSARAATFASAVSADGAVVVGAREFDGQREAFRWERGVLTGLGALRSGEFLHSEAYAVNSDGSVVVGDAETATGGIEAFRWTRADGMKSVRQLLEAAGVRLDGWYLMKATAVSQDGRVIFGHGRNPAGREQSWRAVIDLPVR